MAQRKIVYIIPGYRQRPSNKAYKAIVQMLRSEGYEPVAVTIPWKQTTVSENTEYFLKKFKRLKVENKYILGFSFGAMIAFIASTKVSVSGLILCSLSPYFQEDLAKTKNRTSSITKKRLEDFSQLHSSILAKQIKAKQILMLYGTRESKPLIRRVTNTYSQIPSLNKHLIPINNSDHEIGDKRYLYKIHQTIKAF